MMQQIIESERVELYMKISSFKKNSHKTFFFSYFRVKFCISIGVCIARVELTEKLINGYFSRTLKNTHRMWQSEEKLMHFKLNL
jgi:hypothetical protein